MKEVPFWPRVEICKTANGFIVQQSRPFERSTAVASDQEVYVFNDWPACSDFVAEVTAAARPSNNG